MLPERHPACRRREAQLGFRKVQRTCRSDVKGDVQVAKSMRISVPKRSTGADRLVVAMKRV